MPPAPETVEGPQDPSGCITIDAGCSIFVGKGGGCASVAADRASMPMLMPMPMLPMLMEPMPPMLPTLPRPPTLGREGREGRAGSEGMEDKEGIRCDCCGVPKPPAPGAAPDPDADAPLAAAAPDKAAGVVAPNKVLPGSGNGEAVAGRTLD